MSQLSCISIRCRVLTAVLVASVGIAASAWSAEPEIPAPLPPPPELLGDLPFAPDETPDAPAGYGRYAINPQPIPLPPPQPPPGGVVRPVVADTPTPQPAGLTVSPPRRMPAEYFDLPLDSGGVPGVVMPELDETFAEPLPAGAPAFAGRPLAQGMSIRQLEPFFALAKGSEGAALEAREKNDEAAYFDQLRKSMAAYQDIIDMADAGHEAREEAWYGVARCEYRMGNWWRAFDALERSFPKQYEKSEVAGRIRLEIYIGERLWRMGNDLVADADPEGNQLNGYQAASRVYAAVVFNNPNSEDTALALLRRGDAAALESQWEDAARFYRQVVEYFPESEAAMQARSSLTEAIYRQEWPRGFPEAARNDVASIMDDVERADSRLTEEAEGRRQRAVQVANELEADHKLKQAKEYMRSFRVKKSRDAAVFLLGDICSLYPGTAQAEEAAGMLQGMGIEPPMVLSDATRFPLTAGWSGREGVFAGDGGAGQATLGGAPAAAPVDAEGETPADPFADPFTDPFIDNTTGGSTYTAGQNTSYGDVLPPSPSRETVFETWPQPLVLE